MRFRVIIEMALKESAFSIKTCSSQDEAVKILIAMRGIKVDLAIDIWMHLSAKIQIVG